MENVLIYNILIGVIVKTVIKRKVLYICEMRISLNFTFLQKRAMWYGKNNYTVMIIDAGRVLRNRKKNLIFLLGFRAFSALYIRAFNWLVSYTYGHDDKKIPLRLCW